jgi:hypothetical protein
MFLRYGTKDYLRSLSKDREAIMSLLRDGGRNKGQKLQRGIFFKFYLDKGYTPDTFIELFRGSGMPPHTLRRWKREFAEMRATFSVFDAPDVSTEDLYTELREKLVA